MLDEANLSLTKNTIIYSLSSLVQCLLQLYLVYTLTNHLSPVEFGVVAFFNISINFALYLSNFGIPQAVLRFYYKKETPRESKYVIGNAVCIYGIVSIMLICIYISLNYSHLSLVIPDVFVKYGILIVVLRLFYNIPLILLRAQKKALSFLFINSLYNLFQIILIVNFFNSSSNKLNSYGKAIFYSTLLITILTFWLCRNSISFRVTKNEISALLKYGIPLAFSSILEFSFKSIPRYVLVLISGEYALGIFSLASKLGETMNVLFSQAVSMAWVPYFFSIRESEKEKDIYPKFITYIILLASISYLFLINIGKELLLLLKNEYHVSIKYIPIITLAYAVWGLQKGINVVLKKYYKTVLIARLYAVGAIVILSLSVMLVNKWDICGAGISLLITYLMLIFILIWLNTRSLKCDLEYIRIVKIGFVILVSFLLSKVIPVNLCIFLKVGLKIIILGAIPIILSIVKFYSNTEKIFLKRFLKLCN